MKKTKKINIVTVSHINKVEGAAILKIEFRNDVDIISQCHTCAYSYHLNRK